MTGRIVFLLGLSLIMMVPLSVVAQGLTSEEVQAVMEDPYIRSGLVSCITNKPHPTELNLILIINEKGKAALAFTEPEVDADAFACFQNVVKTLSFKAAGQKFEITYPEEFPAYTGTGTQPGTGTEPGTGTGTQPGTGTEVEPGTGRRVLVQPAETSKPGTQPPGGTALPDSSQLFWKAELRKGKAFVGLGGTMLGLGIAGISVGVIYYAFYGKNTDASPDEQKVATIVIVVTVVAGCALIYGGLNLVVRGQKKIQKANSVLQTNYAFLVPRVALVPTYDPESGARGVMSSLAWTF